jgi:hypothetical protein
MKCHTSCNRNVQYDGCATGTHSMMVVQPECTVWWLCNRNVQCDVGCATGIYSMMLILQPAYTVWWWLRNRNIQYVGFATRLYSVLTLQPSNGNVTTASLMGMPIIKIRQDSIANMVRENGRVVVRPKAPKTTTPEKVNFNIQIHILTYCRTSYPFRIVNDTGGWIHYSVNSSGTVTYTQDPLSYCPQ